MCGILILRTISFPSGVRITKAGVIFDWNWMKFRKKDSNEYLYRLNELVPVHFCFVRLRHIGEQRIQFNFFVWCQILNIYWK